MPGKTKLDFGNIKKTMYDLDRSKLTQYSIEKLTYIHIDLKKKIVCQPNLILPIMTYGMETIAITTKSANWYREISKESSCSTVSLKQKRRLKIMTVL